MREGYRGLCGCFNCQHLEPDPSNFLFLPSSCNSQGEIDAQEDSFKATSQFGQSLISAGHYASEEVKEKVRSKFSNQKFCSTHKVAVTFTYSLLHAHSASRTQLQSLVSEKASLLSLWVQRNAQFDQCMELQLFMRDAEQTDNWMAKQEVRILSLLRR